MREWLVTLLEQGSSIGQTRTAFSTRSASPRRFEIRYHYSCKVNSLSSVIDAGHTRSGTLSSTAASVRSACGTTRDGLR